MRPSKQEFFMAMALLCAKRATCIRRSVGSILTNARGHVLSTGYNGPPSGRPHCTDFSCQAAREKTGEKLDLCKAIHAEQNALLQCRDVYSIESCFTTVAPCSHCLKLLMNTSCKNIYYLEDYPDEKSTEETRIKWEISDKNRVLFKMPMMRIIPQRFVENEYCEWENM